MMQLVPEDEARKWRERVEELRHKPDAEDRIVSVLMDLEIGRSGWNEDLARVKAKAILELFGRVERLMFVMTASK